ncbi:hypothetical protein DPMN_004373 [Dreissena polymorpha]|uniref:Uncharacterized protein n=1 Tax=Dreissena polymorpha TaxID=45954 RepID=A0A9D4MR65_DREPO|nr:hypothetical protein DPMN_004373 [Dreissena polymorpha]
MRSVTVQDRLKAELLAEISKLEADITQWDDFLPQFAKPLFTKRNAVDFYALLTEGRGSVPYAELMQRLQERFGASELTATAQGRFHVAHQEVGESLNDLSLKLATAAFRDLP